MFMNRRIVLGALVLPLLLSFDRVVRAAAPRPPGQGSKTKPTLQERLEKGLKARRPEEFQFIKNVVALVEAGTLPVKLVDSSFHWARRQRRRPFQYFERALIVLAGKKGIKISPATKKVVI